MLDLNGFSLATAEPLTINGTGIGGGGVLINSSGTAVTYTGTIALVSASTIIANNGTINLTTGAISGAFALTLDGTGNGSISSVIGTGANILTKNGTGTWILSGANTYTGTTTVNAGTLQYGNNDVIANTGAVTVSGGTLDLVTFSDSVGTVTLTSGTIASSTGILTGTSYIVQSGVISAILSGAVALTKSTTGTVTLSGANSYTGLTTISAGILKLGATGGTTNTPLGTTAAGTVVTSGAVLDLNGFTLANTGTFEALTLNGGTGIGNGGALTNSSASAASYSGLVTLGGTGVAIATNNGTLNLTNTGTITGSGFTLTLDGTGSGTISSIIGTGSGTLTKNGSGTWTLSGVNTYTGATTVNAGTLKYGASDVIANTSPVTVNYGTLDLNGNSDTIVSLAMTGGAVTTSAGTLTLAGNVTGNASAMTATISGKLELGAVTRIFTISGGAAPTMNDMSITAIISSTGAYGITKAGLGTLKLSGANTYTGVTTIQNGTLSVSSLNSVSGGTASSNLGAPVTSGNGTIALGATTTTGTLLYTGTGETSDRVINLAGSTGGAILDQSGTGLLKFTSAFTVTSASSKTLTLQGSTFGTGEISGVISDGSGLVQVTKTGTGTWTLSGAAANTYTGATTVNAGELDLNKTDGVNAFAGTLTIGDGFGGENADILKLLASNQIPNVAVTVNSSGLFNLNGFSDAILGLTMAGGNVTSGAGTLTLGSNVTGSANTMTATITGNLNLGGGTRNFTINDIMSISAVISNGNVVKADPGTAGILVLSGANTYAGTTTVSAGILKLGAAGDAANTPLGTTAGITSVTSGAVLDLNGYTLGTAEPLTLNGTGIEGGGALMNSGAAATYSGLLTLGSASSIVGGTGTISVSNAGTISGATFGLTLGGAAGGTLTSILGTTSGTLTKTGTGTWTISGANTYTGTTTVSAGILKLGATGGATNTPLGTTGSGTVVSYGAALDLNGYTLANTGTFEALTLNGTGISSGGALMNSGAAATYSGLLTLASASSIVGGTGTIALSNAGTITGATFGLTLGGAAGGTLTSILGTTSGTLTKADAGTWTLSSVNTFTGGTTLNAGQLNINNAQALGTVAGTFTITGGTIDNTSSGDITTLNYPMAWNGDFIYAGTLHNLNFGTGTVTFNASRQVTVNASTLTIGGTVSGASYNLTKAGAGVLALNGTVTINGLTISAGTLSTSSATFNISGNWTNNVGVSGFDAGSSMVIFKGTSQSDITGTTSFYNLTIDTTTDGAKTVRFGASQTQAVTHALILTGASSKVLTINSTDGTNFATLTIPASITTGVDYVNISHNHITIPNTITVGSNSTLVIDYTGWSPSGPGPATQIRVETAADGSGTLVGAQDLASGATLTVYSITRDAAGNFVANITNPTWTLTNKTGNVVDGDLHDNSNGSATLTGLLTGSAKISATSGILTPTTSDVITVIHGAAKSLSFNTTITTGTTVDDLFSTQPVILVVDQFGNPVPNVTITASRSQGAGDLRTTLIETSNASGLVTYTDLGYSKTDLFKVKFSASGCSDLVSAELGPLSPGTADHLQFGTQPTNTVTSQSITPAVTVKILDTYGNLCTDNVSLITIDIKDNPSGGTLSGDNAKNAVGGVATFGNLSIDKLGSAYTFKATTLGLSEGDSNTFNITSSGPVTNATWTGAFSTEWNNPANWDVAAVPSDITAVTIALTNNQPILSDTATIGSLTIDSGATLTTNSNALTVKSDFNLNGAISAGASSITVNGNLTTTSGGMIQGINPTFLVDGFVGISANPINTSVIGTLTVRAAGMQNLTSIVIRGTGNYSYQENIPGFVFANGSLVSYAGQQNFRSSLETGESVSYRALPAPQPLMVPAIFVPVNIMVATPAGPMPMMMAPMPMMMAPMPQVYISTVPKLALTTLPVPRPVVIPALPAKLLFKEAMVNVEILRLSAPETFRNMRVSMQGGVLANFREATVNSITSSIIMPNIFSNIKIFSQIQ